MPKQGFLACFEVVVARFGPPMLECLGDGWMVLGPKMGPKGAIKGSKMGFRKNDPRAFGVHKQVKRAPFERIASVPVFNPG